MKLAIDGILAKKISVLALPVVLGMLSQTTVNMVDAILIGHLPGSAGIDGVAGIGIALPLFWAIGGFFSAISVGTQSVTARRIGEQLPEEAGKVLTNSLNIAWITGVFVSILGYLFIPEFFKLLNPNPNVVRLGSEYCRIRMLGVLSMVATMSMKAFFDGIGKTYVHMTASITMNVINILLNFALVFGLWGFPRLEVAGSAWATVISTYIGLAIMLAWTLKPTIRKRYRYIRSGNLNSALSWEIIRLSVPSGLATIFVMSGFQFFLWVCGHLEPTPKILAPLGFIPVIGPVLYNIDLLAPDLATSASTILISFLMLVIMTSMAFGTATATLVSQSMGAKNFNLAERYGWESAKIGMYVMGLLGIIMVFKPEFFLGIFTDKRNVIEVALAPTRLIASTTALMSAGMILVQALYGAGNTRFVMVAELCLHTVCLIPLSYLLGVKLGLGLLGTWMAAAVYVVLLSSVMALKFYEGKWKQIKL